MENKELKELLSLINESFSQDNMPEVFKPYNIGEWVVFFWGCGGFALIDTFIYNFSEDDGYWFESDCSRMSSAWTPDIVQCLKEVQKYLENNGEPYCYSGTNILCGYKLKRNH